ncbi:MAG: Sua5/YciO/YrdC/YwlC family protein [Pseudomonadales bacterium]
MNSWHLRLAVRVLRRGGLVLHATEGVWGFACDPFDVAAVTRLLTVKSREVGKGLIVIGADAAAFAEELDAIAPFQRDQVVSTWPGAVTWVLPNRRFPPWVNGGGDSVAVRVPGSAQARALCAAFAGPLVSTSANASGHPPPRNRFQARATLSRLRRRGRLPTRRAGLYVLGGETSGRRHPSEIRTLSGQRLRGAG